MKIHNDITLFTYHPLIIILIWVKHLNTNVKVLDIMDEISKCNIIRYFIKVVTPTNLHELCWNSLNSDSIFLVVTSYEQVDGFLKELKKKTIVPKLNIQLIWYSKLWFTVCAYSMCCYSLVIVSITLSECNIKELPEDVFQEYVHLCEIRFVASQCS